MGFTNSKNIETTVLAHYTLLGDSQKIKAAHFLIENMFRHQSVNCTILDQYYAEIAKINKQYQYPNCLEQYTQLYEQLRLPEQEKITVINDTDVISADIIIEHIDAAFDDWRYGLWAQHLTFEEFCEYLLPYRVANEKYEPWRDSLRKDYYVATDVLKKSDDCRDQVYWAACKVNDAIRKLRFRNQRLLPQLHVDWPVSVLRNMRMGECYDYAKLTCYVMRSCGIPVSLDFTPQWPDRAHAHHWNALLDNTGYSMPFMGGESNPGYPSKQGRRMAKVYRYTFAYQPQSLAAQSEGMGQKIPPILSSPFIKDVSEEYFKGRSLSFKLNKAHQRDSFAYIAVFNNQEWIPVDYARVGNDGTATFSNLGSDIVYMPVYWGRNRSVPAGDIVLLHRDGTEQVMTPDSTHLHDITIKRKYPLFDRIVKFRQMMNNSTIEAANSPDFSDAVKFATIDVVPDCGYGKLSIKDERKFRYWRYKAAANKKCYVAEINFFSHGKKLPVKNVLTEGDGLANTKPENVFDDDVLTYFESRLAKHGWVGADFGEPVNIDEVEYVPRNDDNDIVPGNHYELCYFKNGREVIVGEQKAESNSLTFKNVPSGCIYILHNLDKGREERIFTYSNNIINWY